MNKDKLRSLFTRFVLLLVGLNPYTSIAYSPAYTQVEAFKTVLQQSKSDTNRVKELLKLSKDYIIKPGELAADLDSSVALIREAEGLSKKIQDYKGLGNSYLLLSMALREKGEREMGKKNIIEAIALFTKHKYLLELGEAYMELKQYYSAFTTKEELSERIEIVEKALAAFQQASSKMNEAVTWQELADLHSIEGKFPESLLELKKSLKIFQSIGFKKLQGVYDLMGALSSQMGDYREGLRYGLLAAKTSEMVGDSSSQLCTIYNRLGLTNFYLKNFKQAAFYYHKGLLNAKRLKEPNTIHILGHNLINTLQRLNKPAEALALLQDIVKQYPPADTYSRVLLTSNFVSIHMRMKQYTLAKQYCDQLLKIAEEYELNELDWVTYYNTTIKFFLATQQYSQARKHLMAHRANVEKLGILKEISATEALWFKLDSAQGNYLSAISHHQKYKLLEDSSFNEKKSRQISQLEVVYETEKKDKDIKLKSQNIQLLTKQGQLQQTKLQQANVAKNVTFGGVALLLIIVALLYNQYRIKQRSNKEISQKNKSLQHLLNEKEWLLKEIHHRVKNNLHTVMSLLESQSAFLENDALLAIKDSQHRVHAMSLIHQKLYLSENVTVINMAVYLQELVGYLRDSFDSRQRIRFNLQLEPVELDVAQAIPLGLILNEAITNALKYAFPNERKGLISISMIKQATGNFLLTVADNGVGLPAHFNRSSHSLGMSLMKGLSEDISAQFTIESTAGTTITIAFADNQILRFTQSVHTLEKMALPV